MRYIWRLFIYLLCFFLAFSVGSVLVLRVLPITVTPLKVLRLVENFPKKGIVIHSNWVTLENISPVMVRAVVATEDNHFLTHQGFDWKSIKKAWNENREGEPLRGGSTISQQTAKNVFCPPQRTWLRKGVEAYFTLLMELCWSKERIMEVYLNIIETGPNRYGVEAPAKRIYGKSARELNSHEAAMIATVLPSPQRMLIENPTSYMVRRAAQVRGLMNMVGEVDFDNPQPIKKQR